MSPCPYTDAALLRLAVSETAQAGPTRVSCCPACAARAEHWRRFAAGLRRGLRRAACPSTLTLGELALGMLSAAQQVSVASHVRLCPDCSAELALTEHFLSDQRLTWVTLPLAPAGPTAVVRGASPLRLYAAGGYRLALEWLAVAHEPGRYQLQGLLIGFPPGEWTVTASRERREYAVGVDESDQFTLDGLLAGLYQLRLVSGQTDVRIPDVQIGE